MADKHARPCLLLDTLRGRKTTPTTKGQTMKTRRLIVATGLTSLVGAFLYGGDVSATPPTPGGVTTTILATSTLDDLHIFANAAPADDVSSAEPPRSDTALTRAITRAMTTATAMTTAGDSGSPTG